MIIEMPKSSLEMIMATSFPGYDIKISEATTRPKVKKPYTPRGGERTSDSQLLREEEMNSVEVNSPVRV